MFVCVRQFTSVVCDGVCVSQVVHLFVSVLVECSVVLCVCVCVVSGCLIVCGLECMCKYFCVLAFVCVDVIVLHVVVFVCVCWLLHTRVRLHV